MSFKKRTQHTTYNIVDDGKHQVQTLSAPSGSSSGGSGGSITAGTANQVAKYTSSTTIGGTSKIIDDGTSVSLSGTVVLASGAFFSSSHLELRLATTGNLERPIATSVGYFMKPVIPTGSLATEVAAIYIRAEHGTNPLATNFIYGLYGEISDGQSLVGGSMTKIIHKGLGDAHYVALFNPSGGFGYEAAMFTDYENGFIATYQGSGGFQESNPAQANCVGFQALQADNGVNPGFVPNAGLFLANNPTGHAFTARASQYAVDGQAQIRITDSAYTNRWAAFTDGQMQMIAVTASAAATLQNSPTLTLRGNYWNGSSGSSYPVQATIIAQTLAGPQSRLRINLGQPGSETLALILSTASLDLQNHDIVTVNKIQFVSGNTGLDMQTTSIATVGNISFFDGTKYLDLQNSQILNTGKITMQGAGNGLDMQGAAITNGGNITLLNGTKTVDLQNSQMINVGYLQMQGAGTGFDIQGAPLLNAGDLTFLSGTATIDIQTNIITQVGNLQFYGDGDEDIGQPSDTRPRKIYVADSIVIGTGSAASVVANSSYLVLSSSLGSHVVVSGTFMTLAGERNFNTKTVIANYQATNNDYAIFLSASTGNVSVTLPSVLHGQKMVLKRLDGTVNQALISGTAGQTIDGVNVYSLSTQFAAISIIGSGSNWFVVG